MLGDSRPSIREAVIQKFQELVSGLLSINYNRDLLKHLMLIIVDRLFDLYFRQ